MGGQETEMVTNVSLNITLMMMMMAVMADI